MSSERLTVHAPLLSHVEAACTRRSRRELQQLSSDKKQAFIARYSQAQVHPEEAVGIIASQSIGQPSTQIALSSFHNARTTAVEVLEGIPRLESILNCSFKQSTSTIYVTKDVSPSDFVCVTVPDIISAYYIEYDLGSWWYRIAEKHGLYTAPCEYNEGVVFRMLINAKKMADYQISLKTIRDKILESIEGNKSIQVLISPESECIIDISVQRAATKKDKEMFVYNIVKSTIFPIQICGISGIEHAVVDGHQVVTKGSNLLSVLGLDSVDIELTASDSAVDVLKCLGIEVARNVIVRELSKVLKGDIDFNNKHINLLADFMTNRGKMTLVNISGMTERGHSHLTRASNERTMTELAKAACKGIEEPMRSISDSIITGARSRLGTGIMGIIHHT